jgi:hypothetical protein
MTAEQEQHLLEADEKGGWVGTPPPALPEPVARETLLNVAGAPASVTVGPLTVPTPPEAGVAPRVLDEGDGEEGEDGLAEQFQKLGAPPGMIQPAPADAQDGTFQPGLLRSQPGQLPARSVSDGVEAVSSALGGTTTPAPTFTFSTPTSLRGGHPADAHLAAGHSFVCVTARDQVDCYTKGGRAVQIDPASASDLSGETFFSGVITSSDGVFDLRALWDRFRNRFWIAGLTTSSNRVVVAVSKSENPRNGWYKYWLGGTDSRAPNNGSSRSIDYPIIGIDSTAFYVGDYVNSVRDCNGDGVVSAGESCFAYDLVNLRDAQQMADGVDGGSLNGWAFWDLSLPDGSLAGLTPVVHETSTTRGFLLANYGADKISVFAVNNPLTTSQSVSRVEAPITAFGSTAALTGAQRPNSATSTPNDDPAPRVKFDNLGNTPLNGHYRSNKLVLTANDSWLVSGVTRAAARVTQLDLTNYGSGSITVDHDRRFGMASDGDATGSVFDYGWPAAGINVNNDMAIMTVRTDVSVFPELRMSAWGATDADLRSSILARAGSAALYPPTTCCKFHAWVDTSGVSVDPFDETGIYFAQEYANEVGYNNYRELVAKEFGVTLPDIAADSLSASATTIKRGTSVTLTMTAVNQGDATMPASSGQWFLSTNNVITATDTTLGTTFAVGSIATADVSSAIDKSVTIPATTTPGTYFIGACLDSTNVATEYRESMNNCNSGAPASASLPPIQVTITD